MHSKPSLIEELVLVFFRVFRVFRGSIHTSRLRRRLPNQPINSRMGVGSLTRWVGPAVGRVEDLARVDAELGVDGGGEVLGESTRSTAANPFLSAPTTCPPGVPPPANSTDMALDQWSRPASLLILRRAAKFAQGDHQRRLEQAAVIEVVDECRDGLVPARQALANKGRVATVNEATPVGVDNVDAYLKIIESFRWRLTTGVDEAREPGGNQLPSLYVEPEKPAGGDRLAGARVPRRLQDLPLGAGSNGRAARPRPPSRARRAGRGHRARRVAARARCWPWQPALDSPPRARSRRRPLARAARRGRARRATARASSRSSSSPTTCGRRCPRGRTSRPRCALRVAPTRSAAAEERARARSAWPSATHLRPRRLSGGEQQRVAIAARRRTPRAAGARRRADRRARRAATRGSCSERSRDAPRRLRLDGRRRHPLRPRRRRLRSGGRAAGRKGGDGERAVTGRPTRALAACDG